MAKEPEPPNIEELTERDPRVAKLPRWARELMSDLIDERTEIRDEEDFLALAAEARATIQGIWLDVAGRRAGRGDTDGWFRAMKAIEILAPWGLR